MTDQEHLDAGLLALMKVIDERTSDDYVAGLKADNADEYRMLCAAVGAAMEAGNRRRTQDLLECNNRLLQRARLAEAGFVKHVERGSSYHLAGFGTLKTDKPILEGERVVGYWADDGTFWVRPTSEFEDGRFQPEKANQE